MSKASNQAYQGAVQQAWSYRPDAAAYTDQNYGANRQGLVDALAARQQMGAPMAQAAQIAMGPQDQARGLQMGLAGQLQSQALGQGPSMAQMQLMQALDAQRGQAGSIAASAMGQGVAPAVAARMAMQANANAGQTTAAQAAMMRLQEMRSAQDALAGLAGGMRGQDIGLAQAQAGFGQQAALANQAASLQSQGMSDEMARFYTGARLGLDQQQVANSMAGNEAAQDWALGIGSMANERRIADKAAANATKNAWIGGGLGAGGAILAGFAGRK